MPTAEKREKSIAYPTIAKIRERLRKIRDDQDVVIRGMILGRGLDVGDREAWMAMIHEEASASVICSFHKDEILDGRRYAAKLCQALVDLYTPEGESTIL